ncbi:MAG: type I-C CRISPR-associated protein Cas8c/Csd1 [Clostridiaceae bacterium]
MILQALKEYYVRKATYLPPIGWVQQRVDYAIVIDEKGKFIKVDLMREDDGGKKKGFPCTVPMIGKQALKHTNSGDDANLLWDNSAFVLGLGNKADEKKQSFIDAMQLWLGDVKDDGVDAVMVYLKKGQYTKIIKHPDYGEDISTGKPIITFRLLNDKNLFIFNRSAVKKAIATKWDKLTENSGPGICLITGEKVNIETCHTVTKGIWGGQTAGANIVGFNSEAFCSFNKDQGSNAPVGKHAAFQYTTALNHLLETTTNQRIQVGVTSTVFWSAKDTRLEKEFVDYFSEPPKDDPDRNVRAVQSLFRAPQAGTMTEDDDKTRFYVLGLSPNASRIAVRFWIVDTIEGMAGKIRQHFDDLRIDHGPKDREFFPLFRLLVSLSVQGKADNIPPNLAGDTMRAILEGLPYPKTLLGAAIRRIRAEHEVSYYRAALIKACLNRSNRFYSNENEKEMNVSLDISNPNIGYRLGRLFATLEKIQQEASPGINATIRDKFYGAASSTPVTVFGNLMRLKNHHLAKLVNRGRAVNMERLIGEIMEGIGDFPTHLKLEDQGRFAIGYYHQMQNYFTKKSENK